MRMRTCVPVVGCVVRKLRPCPSYSGRGTVTIPYIGVAYTKGGGYFFQPGSIQKKLNIQPSDSTWVSRGGAEP